MFVFIIPRTPLNLRSTIRDALWEVSKKSITNQTSKNWKAIIVGDTSSDQLDSAHFITLDFDNYTKSEKIKKALDYIKHDTDFNPEYLIRFDDDDVFSERILDDIEKLHVKYDCYFDIYHTYIDVLYLKLSQKKNLWIANTAIHKYEHAINYCGPANTQLLMQDHSAYWHTYYAEKKVFNTNRENPLYWRVLTPFSITGKSDNKKNEIDWNKYLTYLDGYGPWGYLSKKKMYYKDIEKISSTYLQLKPKRNVFYWVYNLIKYYKNKI